MQGNQWISVQGTLRVNGDVEWAVGFFGGLDAINVHVQVGGKFACQ
jgi:hypothetical protein